MPKAKNNASMAYERVSQSIIHEFAALPPKQRTRFLFILAHGLREVVVKQLQKEVKRGTA